MVLERILLQTIKFDLQVEHPYQFLLKYAKQLKGKKKLLKELLVLKPGLCDCLGSLRSCASGKEGGDSVWGGPGRGLPAQFRVEAGNTVAFRV